MKPAATRLMGAVVIASACGAALVHAQGRGGGEWTTSQGDAQRTSWVRTDVRLTKDAVQKGELKFLWKMKLDNETRQLNSLTTPVLMDRLISHRGFKALAFVGASAERMYAVDTDLASVYWTTIINYSSIAPPANSSWPCPGGLTAAATRPTNRLLCLRLAAPGAAGEAAAREARLGNRAKARLAWRSSRQSQGRGAAPNDPAAGRDAAPGAPAAPGAAASRTRRRWRTGRRADRQHLCRRQRRLRADNQSAQRLRSRAGGSVFTGERQGVGSDFRRRRALHDARRTVAAPRRMVCGRLISAESKKPVSWKTNGGNVAGAAGPHVRNGWHDLRRGWRRRYGHWWRVLQLGRRARAKNAEAEGVVHAGRRRLQHFAA